MVEITLQSKTSKLIKDGDKMETAKTTNYEVNHIDKDQKMEMQKKKYFSRFHSQ